MVRFYVSFWRQEISMKQKTFRCGRSRHLEFRGIGTALSRQKSFELTRCGIYKNHPYFEGAEKSTMPELAHV